MSSSPDRAAARCACTNISLMQLFHELKQKFPAAPDHAVSAAISAYCHDKRACEQHLESHAEASLAHAYHASSSAAARKLRDLHASLTPLECRNRPIEHRHFPAPASVTALATDKLQNAKLSVAVDDNSNNIDLIEAVNHLHVNNEKVQTKNENISRLQSHSDESPITINIDSCVVNASDAETEDTNKGHSDTQSECNTNDSTGYRILKSNKIKSNLHERLEKCKDKNTTVQKAVDKKTDFQVPESSEKPKRPCTLEFIKPQPEVNIKSQTIPEADRNEARQIPKTETSVVSPATQQTRKDILTPASPWQDHGYPLNLSVNVNCHMDIANRQLYPIPWLEDYESPRTVTSVNLTVCTPPSGMMQSPMCETGTNEPHGFEGHVTVTVSPSAVRPPQRQAPPPPTFPVSLGQRFLPTMAARDQSTAVSSESELIARQLARKQVLVDALRRERERLVRMARETAVLAAPPMSPAAEQQLRRQVEQLRLECQHLAEEREMQQARRAQRTSQADRSPHTQRPRPSAAPARPAPPPPPPEEERSWQCQICTFSNHGLLDKCEQCEMPRILLGTDSDCDSDIKRTTDRTRSDDSGVGMLTERLERSVLLGASSAANSACV